MSLSIVIIGTLDTKGEELTYFKQLIEQKNHRAIIIDCSILGDSPFQADITREQVAEASGENVDTIKALGDEAKAVEKMATGVAKIVLDLYGSGKLDGIFALGGTMGTFLGLSAMKELPLGIPKIMLSTVALTSFIRPDMASPDLILMSPITDFCGLNTILKRVLENAAGMMTGATMAFRGSENVKFGAGQIIGVTTMGTAVCRYLHWLKPLLEKKGYEVLVFHTIGVGGRYLEQVVRQGWINGVLDLATNELINEVCGGSYQAGPERLETAGRIGIPQLISVGGIEAFGWGGGIETLPALYKRRTLQMHSKLTFAVKASEEEMFAAGKLMAQKLNKALGPRVVVIPSRGFSERDKPGGVFYDPEGRKAFCEALRTHIESSVKVIELDSHINDYLFTKEVVKIFDTMMTREFHQKVIP